MTIPSVWFWVLVTALVCVTFRAFWLWVAVCQWKELAMRLKAIHQRDRLMYMAGAKPRPEAVPPEGARFDAADPRYIDPKTFATMVKLGHIRPGEDEHHADP